jgi:(2Fe-2S) ferredoxin
MANFKHHIFVCTNRREPGSPRPCCDPSGNADLHRAFKEAVAARKLKTSVRANKAGCLDQCEHGPNVVVYPDEVWYGGGQEKDVAEIIESHIVSGVPVERLRLKDHCINTPTCEHRLAKIS